MPFCWKEDARAEAEGVVLAVDATRHARQIGIERSTFLSRGLWLRFIGGGPGQEQRLLETLAAACESMSNPVRASEDGTTALFQLSMGGEPVDVISFLDPDRDGITFMLWREFAHRPSGAALRVRVVAEDDARPRA